MSIFTTASIQGNNTVSNLFAELKLFGQRATGLGEVNITATLLRRGNLYYAAAAANLPATLSAMAGHTTSIDQGPTNALLKYDDYVHCIQPPVLLIDNVRAGDRALLEEWGMTEWTERKNSYVGRPSVENFKSIVRLDYEVNSLVPSGHVKIPGYHAFIIGWKSVIEFACWSIGAFQKKTLHVLVAQGDCVEGKESGEADQEGFFDVQWMINPGRWAQSEKMQPQAIAIKDGEIINVPLGPDVGLESTAFCNLASQDWEDYIGAGGYCFPYFRGMIHPDADFLANTFCRHFFTCTSADPDRLAKTLGSIRAGFRHLSLSSAGMELSHALFGVELALQLHAGLKLLCEGYNYKGFALLLSGEGVIFHGNRMVSPMPAGDLIMEIRKLNRHREAVRRIVQEVEGWRMRNGGDPREVEVEVNSARVLADIMRSRIPPPAREDATEGNWQKKMRKDLGELSFADTYWTISADRVRLVVLAMRVGWTDSTAPFFLAPSMEWLTDDVAYALSVFGPRVPTIFAGDTIVTIPSTTVTDDVDQNLATDANGVRRVQYVPLYVQPYSMGVGSWRRVATGSKMMYWKGRGSAYALRNKDQGIISGPDFLPFYHELKEFCESFRRGKAVAGAKRTGEGNVGGEGRPQKMTRKEYVDMYTDF